MADTASSTHPPKGSTKPDGEPTSSKVGNFYWEIVTFFSPTILWTIPSRVGEAITVVPIFYKFSLLQAAAATVNSDASTSKRGSSKVKNPPKFPKLQLLKPENYHRFSFQLSVSRSRVNKCILSCLSGRSGFSLPQVADTAGSSKDLAKPNRKRSSSKVENAYSQTFVIL